MLRREKSQVSSLRRFSQPPTQRQRQVRLSDEAEAEIVNRYRAGHLQREIGEAFGVNRKTIGAVIARHGARRMRGLNEEQIDEAVRRYNHGESLSRIGVALGVSSNTVRTALRQRRVELRERPGWR